MSRFRILHFYIAIALITVLLIPCYRFVISGHAESSITVGLAPYLATVFLATIVVLLSIRALKTIKRQKNVERTLNLYARQLEIVHELDEAILAIQTPESIARIAIDHLNGFMYCQKITVHSYSLENRTSHLLASWAPEGHSPPDIPLVEEMPGTEQIQLSVPQVKDIGEDPKTQQITVPLLAGEELIGQMEILCSPGAAVRSDELMLIKEISGPMAIAIQNGRLFTSVDEHRQQLRSLSTRLTEMEEAVRAKIAVELHDRVGQNLTALNLNLNIIKSRIRAGKNDSALNSITDSFVLIEETTEQIRDIMSELRPPNLDDHGLPAALEWYTAQRSRRTGLGIEVESDDPLPRLPLEVETIVFRITQEALNNVVKHAQAAFATIRLEKINGGIRVTIQDDGIGFDTRKKHLHNHEQTGLGLIAMNERIAAIGGTMTIDSVKGKGTSVTIEVHENGN